MWDRISIRAVVIAFAVGLAASFVLGGTLIGAFAGDSIDASMSDEAKRAALDAIVRSPAFLLTWLLVSISTTVWVGWLAARIAKHFPLYNGLAVGVLIAVVDLLFHDEDPVWFVILNLLLTLPASVYGAALARRYSLPKSD